MTISESLPPVEHDGIKLVTTVERRHDSFDVVIIAEPELGVRLEASSLKHFALYWPTEIVDKNDAIDLIYRVGRMIKADRYAYSRPREVTWIARQDTTAADTQSTLFHMSLINSMLRGYKADDELTFTGLAAANQENTYVWWQQAFNDDDFAVNTLSMSGYSEIVHLTDSWVGDFLQATAHDGLSRQARAILMLLQDRFECEGLMQELRNMKLPID